MGIFILITYYYLTVKATVKRRNDSTQKKPNPMKMHSSNRALAILTKQPGPFIFPVSRRLIAKYTTNKFKYSACKVDFKGLRSSKTDFPIIWENGSVCMINVNTKYCKDCLRLL